MATVVPRVRGGAQLRPRRIRAARPRQQPVRPWRTRDLGGRMRWRLMVLLLKVHRAAGKLMGAASAALSVAAAARRWVAAGRTDTDAGAASHEESPAVCTRFYGFLCTSLVLSMLLLAADVAAHLQGWHLAVDVPDLLAVKGLFSAGYAPWRPKDARSDGVADGVRRCGGRGGVGEEEVRGGAEEEVVWEEGVASARGLLPAASIAPGAMADGMGREAAAAVVAVELEDSTERKVREGDGRSPYRFTEATEC
ncbi:unnamed protein product [Miscanthus lutarioriparius]|uniref:Uncharacterized protein n=1 Tax=Miscanthus lutarioriparius TaxID=422564 RepID=A0A811SGH7_9POAL|nr:unnamed protein product [Miscanthus lutarioriparius]